MYNKKANYTTKRREVLLGSRQKECSCVNCRFGRGKQTCKISFVSHCWDAAALRVLPRPFARALPARPLPSRPPLDRNGAARRLAGRVSLSVRYHAWPIFASLGTRFARQPACYAPRLVRWRSPPQVPRNRKHCRISDPATLIIPASFPASRPLRPKWDDNSRKSLRLESKTCFGG